MADPGGNGGGARGFALVEVLVLLALLGVVSGLVVMAFENASGDAGASPCRAERSLVRAAVDAYVSSTGTYPTAAAAGGARHTALDLLDGYASTSDDPPIRLKTVPPDYTIDDFGHVIPNATDPHGCT